MTDITKKYIYLALLFLVLMYFSIQETGVGLSVLLSAGWIGRIVGGLLGTLAGGVIAVYPYLIIRRIFLKIGFPSRAELIGFILYTMIIIVAIRQIPR